MDLITGERVGRMAMIEPLIALRYRISKEGYFSVQSSRSIQSVILAVGGDRSLVNSVPVPADHSKTSFAQTPVSPDARFY